MVINLLKKIRIESGVTQEELSQKARVTLRSYRYYESGERVPNVHTAQRLAMALGVKIEDLFPLNGASLRKTN